MGLIIIISNWLQPIYLKTRKCLDIRNSNIFWKLFRIIRTFWIFALIEVIPEVGTVADGFGIIKCSILNSYCITQISDLLPSFNKSDFIKYCAAFIGLVIMLIVSIKNRKMRFSLNDVPLTCRIIIISVLILLIISIGFSNNSSGGFMYEVF